MNINDMMQEILETGVNCVHPESCERCPLFIKGKTSFKCFRSFLTETFERNYDLRGSVTSEEYADMIGYMMVLVNGWNRGSSVCEGIACSRCKLAKVYSKAIGTYATCEKICWKILPNLKKHLLSNKTNT